MVSLAVFSVVYVHLMAFWASTFRSCPSKRRSDLVSRTTDSAQQLLLLLQLLLMLVVFGAGLIGWESEGWLSERADWLFALHPVHPLLTHSPARPSLSLSVGEVCRWSRWSLCSNSTTRNGRQSKGWKIKRQGKEGAKGGSRCRPDGKRVLWVSCGLAAFNERNEVSSDTKLRHKQQLPVCCRPNRYHTARLTRWRSSRKNIDYIWVESVFYDTWWLCWRELGVKFTSSFRSGGVAPRNCCIKWIMISVLFLFF